MYYNLFRKSTVLPRKPRLCLNNVTKVKNGIAVIRAARSVTGGYAGRSARPDLRQRVSPSGLRQAKLLRWVEKSTFASRFGDTEVSGFWPMKVREKPWGKSELSPQGFSLTFTGRFASGQAAFSRPAKSITSKVCLFLSSSSGNKTCFMYDVNSAVAGPEDEPPKAVCGRFPFGGEISRNEQSPHEAELRPLRLRIWGEQRPASPFQEA